MVGLISRIRFSIHFWKKRREKKRRMPEIMLEDLWSLDTTLAEVIARYLKEFREAVSYSGATPGIFVGEYGDSCWDEWSATIDKMTYAFAKYAKHSSDMKHPVERLPKEEQDKIKEGMQLFIKYFRYLNY